MENLDSLAIPDEQRRYIMAQLAPTMEEMVADCIRAMPADPVPFMLDWLERKKAADEKRLTPAEPARLTKEGDQSQAGSPKQAQKVKAIAKSVGFAREDLEEVSDDDDDELDEPPEWFVEAQQQTAHSRQSVSAEVFGEWNRKRAFTPPLIPKTEEQKRRLRSCLTKSFMFSALEDSDLSIVIGAMQETAVGPSQCVFEQGDDGESLYVVDSGSFDCHIQASGEQKVLKTCAEGDVFGELALLYNCPRAASVTSKDAGVLWQLDRGTFNHIVKDAAQRKRQRYDAFLSKVPLLSSMDAYERSQLADALRSEVYSDGMTIVWAGDVGDTFYILEEGQATATKGGQVVMTYGSGDYFGELALLRDQPRAATVTSKGMAKVLSLDSGSFKRLLNVDELLKRVDKYT